MLNLIQNLCIICSKKFEFFTKKKYFFYYLSLSTFCVPEQGGSKKAKTPWEKMFVVCMTLSEMGVGNALTQKLRFTFIHSV